MIAITNFLINSLICFICFSVTQLNKVVTGPRHPGVIGDRGSGSFSRESKYLSSSDIMLLWFLSSVRIPAQALYIMRYIIRMYHFGDLVILV